MNLAAFNDLPRRATSGYPLAEWAEVVGIRDLMPRLDQLLISPMS